MKREQLSEIIGNLNDIAPRDCIILVNDINTISCV